MQDARPHIVVLIPTYDEAENVVPMLEAIDRLGQRDPARRFTSLVVDDHSPDGTAARARAFAGGRGDIHVLERAREGLGRAMIAGCRHAQGPLRADVVATIDCDFQWNPDDLPRLLDALDAGADVAVASRHAPGGGLEGWPMGRRFTHWVANTVFATWVAGSREVLDHNGNMRALRVAGCLDRIDWDRVPVRGYAFFNWMIHAFSEVDARFAEVPVTFRWRERGHSKVSFTLRHARTFARDTLEYVRSCLWIRVRRRAAQR